MNFEASDCSASIRRSTSQMSLASSAFMSGWFVLDVAGKEFRAMKATLAREPNSLLARLVEENVDPEQLSIDSGGLIVHLPDSGSGRWQLDSNAEYFEYILKYLRTGKFNGVRPEHSLEDLMDEAEMFRLSNLEEMCRLKIYERKMSQTRNPCSSTSPSDASIYGGCGGGSSSTTTTTPQHFMHSQMTGGGPPPSQAPPAPSLAPLPQLFYPPPPGLFLPQGAAAAGDGRGEGPSLLRPPHLNSFVPLQTSQTQQPQQFSSMFFPSSFIQPPHQQQIQMGMPPHPPGPLLPPNSLFGPTSTSSFCQPQTLNNQFFGARTTFPQPSQNFPQHLLSDHPSLPPQQQQKKFGPPPGFEFFVDSQMQPVNEVFDNSSSGIEANNFSARLQPSHYCKADTASNASNVSKKSKSDSLTDETVIELESQFTENAKPQSENFKASDAVTSTPNIFKEKNNNKNNGGIDSADFVEELEKSLKQTVKKPASEKSTAAGGSSASNIFEENNPNQCGIGSTVFEPPARHFQIVDTSPVGTTTSLSLVAQCVPAFELSANGRVHNYAQVFSIRRKLTNEFLDHLARNDKTLEFAYFSKFGAEIGCVFFYLQRLAFLYPEGCTVKEYSDYENKKLQAMKMFRRGDGSDGPFFVWTVPSVVTLLHAGDLLKFDEKGLIHVTEQVCKVHLLCLRKNLCSNLFRVLLKRKRFQYRATVEQILNEMKKMVPSNLDVSPDARCLLSICNRFPAVFELICNERDNYDFSRAFVALNMAVVEESRGIYWRVVLDVDCANVRFDSQGVGKNYGIAFCDCAHCQHHPSIAENGGADKLFEQQTEEEEENEDDDEVVTGVAGGQQQQQIGRGGGGGVRVVG